MVMKRALCRRAASNFTADDSAHTPTAAAEVRCICTLYSTFLFLQQQQGQEQRS